MRDNNFVTSNQRRALWGGTAALGVALLIVSVYLGLEKASMLGGSWAHFLACSESPSEYINSEARQAVPPEVLGRSNAAETTQSTCRAEMT